MSRIGKQIIEIPSGVTATLAEGVLTIQGSKGTLTRDIHEKVMIHIADNNVTVDVAKKEDKKERSLWGTFASHVANMITGVTDGFRKQLEVNGVGYKVVMQGKDIKLDVGFSHSVVYKMPEQVLAKVEKNVITLESSDKEALGATAAEIRAIKKPEPYKGKGIKYIDEVIRRKAGKTAAKAA